MNIRLLKLIIVGIAVGLATGIGVYTFIYAKGYSYLSLRDAGFVGTPTVAAISH